MGVTDSAVRSACDVLDAWTASKQTSAVDLGRDMVEAALRTSGVALLETEDEQMAALQEAALAVPTSLAVRYASRRVREAALEDSLRAALGDWDDGGDPRKHAECVSKWTTQMFDAEADDLVECAVETAQKMRDADLVVDVDDAAAEDSDSETLDSDDDDFSSEEDVSSDEAASSGDDEPVMLKKQKHE